MIIFRYWNFFGSYKDLNLLWEVNVILLLSFLLYCFSFFLGTKFKYRRCVRFYSKIISKNNLSENVFTSDRSLRIYTIVVLIYCVYDLFVNTILYGSLESALIRFYGKTEVGDLPSLVQTSLLFFYKAVVSFLFVFRFFLNKKHKSLRKLFIPLILLILIAFPAGSRGAVVAPIIMIFTADCFSATYIKSFSLFRNVKSYIILLSITIFLFLSLTVIRNTDFNKLEEVGTVLSDFSMDEASDLYSKSEGDLILADVQYSYTKFGNDVPFLSPFYTLNTLLIAPVPRSLVPSKPVSFGSVLNGVKLGYNTLDPDVLLFPGAITWAAGYAGEGWANGGMVGVIFYSVLFGLLSGFCSKMYYTLFQKLTPLSILIGLLFFMFASSSIRGDILAGFVTGFYPLVIVTLFFWLRK